MSSPIEISTAARQPVAPIEGLSSSARLIELDMLRGLAILLVLAAHYRFPKTFTFLDPLTEFGNRVGGIGVDLFFTLSGFLVGGLLLKEYKTTGGVDTRRFLTRRAFKIWPALYVLIIFHIIVGRHDLSTFVWQNLFHVQNYFGTSILHTWSLAVEEHFYILLALVLALFARKGPKVVFYILIAICLTSTVARFWIVSQGDLDAAFRQTQYRADALLYGVLIAFLFNFNRPFFDKIAAQRSLLLLMVAALVVWVILVDHRTALYRSIGYSLTGIGFVALILLVYTHSSFLKATRIYRAIAWIGVYSYGIYLWHTLALAPGAAASDFLTRHHMQPVLAWVLVGLIQCAIGIVVGFVMTKLVEWPMLRFRERYFPASRSSRAGANGKSVPLSTTRVN